MNINPKHLNSFVARTMANLSDSMAERKEDLVTLLCLLPKNYEHRNGVIKAIEAIRAHELAQLKFQDLLQPADHRDGHNGKDHNQ